MFQLLFYYIVCHENYSSDIDMSGAVPGTTVSTCRHLHNDLCFKSYGLCTYADTLLAIVAIKCEVQVV